MARKKRTATNSTPEQKGNLTDGFKSQWFIATLDFVKDDKKLSLQYPRISHAQAEYICSLIRPNTVKTWVDSKPEYAALYEALILFGLKFEFQLSLTGGNSKKILITKVPKNEKKTEAQTSGPQTQKDSVITDTFKHPKAIDKISHSFMLETTQLILNFIEDKTRATFEITNVKPLECLFLQCAMSAARPLFPEHSKMLSYVKMLTPSQDFYLKIDVVKLNKGKSTLRNVMFTKVPKFGSKTDIKTNTRKTASKTHRSLEIVEPHPIVYNAMKTLDALNLGKECPSTSSNKLGLKSVNSISFIGKRTDSASNKSLKEIDSAQTSMSKMTGDALSKGKSNSLSDFTTSESSFVSNIPSVSQKYDENSNFTSNLSSDTNSVPSNSKLMLSNCIVSKSSQCDCSVSSQILTPQVSSSSSPKCPVDNSSTLENVESLSDDLENLKSVSKNEIHSEVTGSDSNLTESQIDAKLETADLKTLNSNSSSLRENLLSAIMNCANADTPKTNLKSSNSSSRENSKSPNICSPPENVESLSNSPKSNCVSTGSSKTDLQLPNFCVTENTNSSILEKFLHSISSGSRNSVSSKISSNTANLGSISKTTVDTKIITKRTTGKSILSRSVPDLRAKLQNIQSSRSESILHNEMAYEDFFRNINKPFHVDFPYSVESPRSMESNLVRTVSTPTLTTKNLNMCKNSFSAISLCDGSLKTLGVSSGCSNAFPQITESSSSRNCELFKAESNSTLESGDSSRNIVTREWYPSNLAFSNQESSTELMSTRPSVLDGTREMSASSARVSQLSEKFERFKRELATTNKSKITTRSKPVTKDTRKIELMEALSVPVHIEKSARIMKMMGYQGGPLGVRGDGITEPIMPTLDLVNRAGLGYAKGHPKKFTGESKQGGTKSNSGSNDIPTLKSLPTTNNMLVTQGKKSKGKKTTQKCLFRIMLLTSAIELVTKDVANVKVTYNRVPRKQRGFVKYFLKMVNERRNLSFGSQEEVRLFEELKVAMKTSPWNIEGAESYDMKHVTLRKVSSKGIPSNTELIKPMKTGLAPRYSINFEDDETDYEPDTFDDNDNPIVHITDKRLNYYMNNVSFPKLDGYPQICTSDLAFRLIILDEILEFSRSDETYMTIDIGVEINKKEQRFINNLMRPKPDLSTQLEKDTYDDILFMVYKQNSFLHIEGASESPDQKRLFVQKLLDNPENRKKSRQRHKKINKKNSDSNQEADTSITNNVDNVTKVTPNSNDNMPNIYIINQNDNIQIQISKDTIENIKYSNSNQATNKEGDNTININEKNDKNAITIKRDLVSNDGVKPIVIDIKKNNGIKMFNDINKNIIDITENNKAVTNEQNLGNDCNKQVAIDINKYNDIKILSENDKENELLKSEDDDVLIVDIDDEIILLSDEETDEPENLSTVNKEIEYVSDVSVKKEIIINEELVTDKEITNNTETPEIVKESDVKKSNSYSDVEFEKDLNDLEQLMDSMVDETEVFTENETDVSNKPITRKRSRTDSEPYNDSKKSKGNSDEFKTVTITPVNQEENITQELVIKIQTIISDAIDSSNELPLFKCHGVVDGGLVYSCHDEKSYLFMEKCLNATDFKMLDSVTIENKCYKLKIRLNTCLENVTRIFNKLEQYNVGLNTEKWCVKDVLKNSDHIIILVEVDTDSFKYVSENNFSLYAGVDMATFSVYWD